MGKDKVPTGEATVTYENPESSMRAIEQFNGNDFNGQGNISVSIATPDQKQPFAQKLVSSDFLIQFQRYVTRFSFDYFKLRDANKGGRGGYGGYGGYGGGYGGGRGGGRGRGRGGGFRGGR